MVPVVPVHRKSVTARTCLRTAFVCALLASAIGCAKHAGSIPPAPQPSDKGAVGYEFIANAAPGSLTNTEHQEFITPTPLRKLLPPEYPERPLLEKAPHYEVTIRIVIDTEGRVSMVSDSPLGISTAGPYAQDFRRAVEATVRRWRFLPGRIDQLEDGDDVDDDGKPDSVHVARSDFVPVFYDVRFDFDIVAGEGRVSSSATPGPGTR